MELICYLHPGWEPLIRPAEATREWMNDTPEAFAYRCLRLNIANAHGWEVLSPCTIEARWWGGTGTDQLEIRLISDVRPGMEPVSLFGQGVLTFHVADLFRTPPGWNLWVGGSPNRPKESIYPLAGVVETDWAPYTFAMNWRFTRTYRWVWFEAGEPICFFFPIQRGYLEEITPKFVPMEAEPEVLEQFHTWSKSRDEFHARMARETPQAGSDKWQNDYYRGVDAAGRPVSADHQTKLRLAGFTHSADPPRFAPPPQPAETTEPVEKTKPSPVAEPQAIASMGADSLALKKRDWLLQSMDRHWQLSNTGSKIERRMGLTADEFLERYYAPGRPVILVGEMAEWPALSRWTPAYLRDAIGAKLVEFQGERSKNVSRCTRTLIDERCRSTNLSI
jgi:hypothetical protein